jgi:hypothetical protein
MTQRVLRQQRPAFFYVHPREIDLDSLQLAIGLLRRFKSYVNIRTTEPKIKKVLSDFEMVTFREYLLSMINLPPAKTDSLVSLSAATNKAPGVVKV